MIAVKNISKKFGDIQAVNNLSFEVKEGEILGLLGPNGAGKSTTMRIMSGFMASDEGDVFINEVSVLDDPIRAQKNIGYLPENNPLYKDMLVSELLNISANLREIPKNELKKSLDFVVKAVNIKDVYYRPIGELSKGYKQRVGIALALIHKPKVLIMDEPTEGLDPNQRTEIRNLIKTLSKDLTVIISTHVLQEVEAICTRMVIINKGAKVADGTVNELLKTAADEKMISAKIEGKNVEENLSKLDKLKGMEFSAEKDNITSVILKTDVKTNLQPDISKLAQKNNWVIWELIEQKRHLEDVFKELTVEK